MGGIHARRIKRLMDCDILALLPGWERSRGANIERNLAITLGMPSSTPRRSLSPTSSASAAQSNSPAAAFRATTTLRVPAPGRNAGVPVPEDQLATARQALEQIAALTDVSTGGIGMDVLKIAKQALSQ